MGILKTVKKEKYAQNVAQGISQRKSYILAGYQDTPNADAMACTLLKEVKVRNRVTELLEAGARKAIVNIAKLTGELEDARLKAMDENQLGAAVSATSMKAKLNGLMPEQQSIMKVVGADGGAIITDDVNTREIARRIAFAMARAAPEPVEALKAPETLEHEGEPVLDP